MDLLGLIVSIVLSFLLAGLVIWIVGRLGLGLEVSGYKAALIAAIVIAIVSWVLTWLLGQAGVTLGGTGVLGGIVNLIVAAVVLMISERFVSGMRVKGFTGAIVAALAIGVVNWLLVLVLEMIGLA